MTQKQLDSFIISTCEVSAIAEDIYVNEIQFIRLMTALERYLENIEEAEDRKLSKESITDSSLPFGASTAAHDDKGQIPELESTLHDDVSKGKSNLDPNELDSDDEAMSDQDYEEAMEELFTDLRQEAGCKSKKIKLSDFISWGQVQAFLESGDITMEELTDVLKQMKVGKSMTFNQFKRCMGVIDELLTSKADASASNGDPSILPQLSGEEIKQEANDLFKNLTASVSMRFSTPTTCFLC